MDKKQKLQHLLNRKEKADQLPPQEKIRWKDEISKLEQEVKQLREEMKRELMTEEEATILDVLAINKTAIQYLYERFIDENSSIVEELIDETSTGIYDYFQTKEREYLETAKLLNHTLLETIYQHDQQKDKVR